MLGRIAELHYSHGMTHQEVADLLGLSRVQVTRLLARARAEGIVEIRVHNTEPIFPVEQQQLVSRYGLESAWIAPSFPDPLATLDSIGTVGANYLRSVLKPGMTIAVGLSSTIASVVSHLSKDPIDVTFIPAIGSRPAADNNVNPHQVAELLANAVGGKATHLASHFLASTFEAAKMIRAEPEISQVLEAAREADLGLFGIGGLKEEAGTVLDTMGFSTDTKDLLQKGVVGDISACLFDKAGQSVTSEVTQRVVGLHLDEIMSIRHRTAFAGGVLKVDAIAGALAGGIITTLVTDIDTARLLLKK
jgi:lsr operon transcriptional repressor